MNGLSLFANVGIGEIYMKKHNIDIVVANELLTNRAEFYRSIYNDCNMIDGDITDINIFNKVLCEAKSNNCEFLIATPPCQGMSVAGKMDENDSRNILIKYVVNVIEKLRPKYIIIENVAGVLQTFITINNSKIRIVDYIKDSLEPIGYKINYQVIDVADYGTPQTRKRAIFLISNIGYWNFPPKEKKITVREAISHLPSIESGEVSDIDYHFAKQHNKNHILWLQHTPSGKTAFDNEIYYPQKDNGERIKGYSTTYKRIDWDKPAPTITMCNGAISSQNNVHPGRIKKDGLYSDARVLSLKEIFILTGLPDNWHPPKWASENLIRQVIGEGVPPQLIDRLLKTIPKSSNE